MKRLGYFLLLIGILAASVEAADLYKISVNSQTAAEILRDADVEPVYRLTGGYLILTDGATADKLTTAGLDPQFLAGGLRKENLAVDSRFDRANVNRFPLVYEDGGLRFYRVDNIAKALSEHPGELIPLSSRGPDIFYEPPLAFNPDFLLGNISLDSLIDPVSQDTIESYLFRLEAYFGRLTGTDSNYAARDWIYDHFVSYGLDSVALDSFTGIQLGGGGSVPAYNVVGYKWGTRYPGRHIVIGGHFDAVPGSPGVDDNGTGTVGTMEIARALQGVETEMTFVFIAFDSEESGLIGSRHYADAAKARGDTIVYMLNMDMIGHITNSDTANLHQGPNDEPYALLWGRLADSLVGITGIIAGSSGGSDHASFANDGYDVTFVQEYRFSTVYHQPHDSTAYINFEYATRMIKASLATVYMVNTAPKPVTITSILDVGDGQSLQVNWAPEDTAQVDHFRLYWTTVPATQPDSIQITKDSSSYAVSGLTEGKLYSFYMIAVDTDGRSSVAFMEMTGTPYSKPALPEQLTARPLRDSVRLEWAANNTELDFDHYAVIRDGSLLPDIIFSTFFIDSDPSLDTLMHDYLVVAVDDDGNISDTVGAQTVSMKVARLVADRVLAVNRSGSNSTAMVDETVTGEFMREALTGWNYTYFSDTAAANPNRAGLLNMIDYGLVVIGAESGRQDDIGNDPAFGGILGDIGYYLSIGGKVIIFGRWGDIALERKVDSSFYTPGSPKFVYTQYFDIAFRIRPLSYLHDDPVILESDFVGAISQATGYPDLSWDEAQTNNHSGAFYANITGIPCPSIPYLVGVDYQPVYTYQSGTDSILTSGKVIGWRHLGPDYHYIFFDIPLSFMERPAAVQALRQAVLDMEIVSDVDDDDFTAFPDQFQLRQNYPNPFNPRTIIEFYNPKLISTPMKLEVYNILGQRVKILHDGPAQAGLNRVEWDGADENGHAVASGIYFYRLKIDDEAITRKMLLLK